MWVGFGWNWCIYPSYISLQLLVLLPQFIEITFFHLYQKDKSSDSKLKFRQASNRCKRVPEAAKHTCTNKTQEYITSQKLGCLDIWWIATSVHNKGKSATPLLFNGLEVLPSAYDKAKLFAENFSKNSNLDDSGISDFSIWKIKACDNRMPRHEIQRL